VSKPVQNREHLARLVLECMPEHESAAPEDRCHLADELSRIIEKRFGAANLPRSGETVAVTLDKPKTGALFFDRVWYAPGMSGGPPDEVTVFGATDVEVWPLVVTLALQPPSPLSWARVERVFGTDTIISELWAQKAPAAKNISDSLFLAHRFKAVPMYESADACARDYHLGDTEVIVATIEKLGLVDEARLDWQQVLDFRNDQQARVKLRRMRHWLDSELEGRPISYVADALATRLDDYEWAPKKHGIETVTGSLSDLLDIRFLPAASAATAGLAVGGGPFWAAVGAASLAIGKVALSLTARLVDLRDRTRGNGSEVAFVHELKKLSGQKARSRVG